MGAQHKLPNGVWLGTTREDLVPHDRDQWDEVQVVAMVLGIRNVSTVNSVHNRASTQFGKGENVFSESAKL